MSAQTYQNCITACLECAVECARCSSACLSEKDVAMLAHCIKTESVCTDMCFLAAKAMASGSDFAKQICKLCAEICTACAVECEKHSHMDHCKKCAEVCRKCAAECSKM